MGRDRYCTHGVRFRFVLLTWNASDLNDGDVIYTYARIMTCPSYSSYVCDMVFLFCIVLDVLEWFTVCIDFSFCEWFLVSVLVLDLVLLPACTG